VDGSDVCPQCDLPPSPLPPPTLDAAKPPVQTSRQRGWLLPVTVLASVATLLAVGALFVLMRDGGSSTNGGPGFVDLIEVIEETEVVNETLLDETDAAASAFFDSWDGNNMSQFDSLAVLWLDETYIATDEGIEGLRRGIAEMQAMKLEEPELREVREAAIRHYSAWIEWSDLWTAAVESWTLRDDSEEYFEDELEKIVNPISPEISDSFKALCGALGDAQPSDRTFEVRIAELCAE
jgi:hypothetical protein